MISRHPSIAYKVSLTVFVANFVSFSPHLSDGLINSRTNRDQMWSSTNTEEWLSGFVSLNVKLGNMFMCNAIMSALSSRDHSSPSVERGFEGINSRTTTDRKVSKLILPWLQ